MKRLERTFYVERLEINPRCDGDYDYIAVYAEAQSIAPRDSLGHVRSLTFYTSREDAPKIEGELTLTLEWDDDRPG